MNVDQPLAPIRRQIAAMTSELFTVIGLPFEKTTELQRQILATFAFGMAFAEGMSHHLTPPQIHALAISYLMDTFRYADHQATAFSGELIAATSSNDPKNTHKAIIHRGIDGHLQLRNRELDRLKNNIEDVFKALGAQA